ncbi:MAG: hypothetical protein FJX66_09280 [Alphaproteobacteria bacterium]|nr:hypothetical protein [Alphaproteobacteria bacterium]
MALLVLIVIGASAHTASAADKRNYTAEIAHNKGLADADDVFWQEQLGLLQSLAAILRGWRERYLPAKTRNYDEALRWLRPLAEVKRPKAMARGTLGSL